MRTTLYASLALLGVLHLAASVPHGLVSHDTPAVLPGGSVTSPPESSDDCRNASSSASQKRSPQVIREKTVITIERNVQIEPLNDQEGCPCTCDQVRRCQACLNCEKKREADTSSPTPNAETQTSASTQTPTAPVTFTATTTPETQTTARTPGTTVPLLTSSQKPPGPRPRGQCTSENCKPPNCACMSTKPPGGLDAEHMPQFVMLTFDDAVTSQNMLFYRELLGDLKRKNKASGCRIAATFFASAEYLDYPSVNELYNGENEIALHSISHKTLPDYWNGLDTDGWEREVVDERKMIEKFADVPAKDINGFRGPFLFTGGDNGFRMLQRHLKYDSTLVHQRQPGEVPVFPYTLDYGFDRMCAVAPCPKYSHPGLWEVPMNVFFKTRELHGSNQSVPCSMVDACVPSPVTASETFDYFRSNFDAFYSTNRAPFPVFLHEAWLKHPARKEGYLRFVDWLLEKEDVFLVTVSEVLDFMRDPKPLGSYRQRRCRTSDLKPTCQYTTSCTLEKPLDGTRYMRTCATECPKNYPWVGNPLGE